MMIDWFAAYTYPRHEKKVAEYLKGEGVECFLPLYKESRMWNNGLRVIVEKPLFPSYIFVHVDACDSLRVLRTPSVASMVTLAGVPVPLPRQEVESLIAGAAQLEMFAQADEKRRRLAHVVDDLNQRGTAPVVKRGHQLGGQGE